MSGYNPLTSFSQWDGREWRENVPERRWWLLSELHTRDPELARAQLELFQVFGDCKAKLIRKRREPWD